MPAVTTNAQHVTHDSHLTPQRAALCKHSEMSANSLMAQCVLRPADTKLYTCYSLILVITHKNSLTLMLQMKTNEV